MKPNRPIKNVQIRESDCKTIYKILSPILTQGIDVEIRTSPNLTFNNETLSISQWAEKLNVPSSMLYYRANNGYSDEEVFKGVNI